MPTGVEVAPVDVDDVGDRHEREEGDPDRQDDRACFEREVEAPEREQVVRRGDEEVVVLEVAEQAQVSDERDHEQLLARLRALPSVDGHGQHLVPGDREREQEAEPPVPAGVEDEARGDDDRSPALAARHQQPRERQHDHEEDREGCGREEHGSRGLLVARASCRFRRQSVAAGGSRAGDRSPDDASSIVSSPFARNHVGSSGSTS